MKTVSVICVLALRANYPNASVRYYPFMLISVQKMELLSIGETMFENAVRFFTLSNFISFVISIQNLINRNYSLGVHCPTGLRYEICGNTCQRSCGDISHKELCKETCVEGCYCPGGYTFDENENCIPISDCPCRFKNQKYLSKQVDFRNETSELQSWYVIRVFYRI